MGYLIILICMMIVIMNILKIIFAEMDGRRANKQFNVAYFLQFTRPFAYGRTSYIIFIALLIFLFTNDLPLFSMAWLLEFVTLLCVSVIIDVVSQFTYYKYAQRRFKDGVDKAIAIRNKINEEKTIENKEDIIYPEPGLGFEEVVESYLTPEDHLGIASMDAGEFADSIRNLPDVTYVIDTRKVDAEHRLADKGVKVTTLTQENRLPFKDGKLDTYIVAYTNFDKTDVHRILKMDGILLVKQRGGDNLKELNPLYMPINPNTKWNKYACQAILDQNGFTILDGKEQLAKIGFRSLSALFTYLKEAMPDRVTNSDMYINQYAYIDECMKQRGFFELTIHEFYLVCRKK